MTTEEKMLEVVRKIAKAEEEAKNAINQIAAYEYEQKIRKLTDELVGLYDALERQPAVQVAKAKTISQIASASAQRNTQKIRKSLMEGGLTIEEAKLQTRHAYRTYKYGFINGMKAMKKIDIDKAVEWINANWRKYIDTDADGMIRFAGWKLDFKKYMEKEL